MADSTASPSRKLCSRCKKRRHTSDFGLDSGRRDGLNPWCRPCKKRAWKREYARLQRLQRFGEQLQLELDIKQCASCRASKSTSEFNVDRKRKDGLTVYCKPCATYKNRDHMRRSETGRRKKKAAYRRWRQANRDSELERLRLWRTANPETAKACTQAWRRANPDKIRHQAQVWKAANPEAFRIYGALRRAREVAATTVPFTAQELAARWAYYGNRCWLCGTTATATDHVKPLSKGGAHMLCNLRPICKPCNSAKHNKWPFNPELVRVA